MTPREARNLSLSFVLIFVVVILLFGAWFALGVVAEENKERYPWMARANTLLFLCLIGAAGAGIYIQLGLDGIIRLFNALKTMILG